MDAIKQAILDGAPGDEIGSLEIPESTRAAFTRRDEEEMFQGIDFADKDPRKSLHVEDVPTPPLGPNECLVAVMASAINFNTVWTSIFEPVSTFRFLEKLGKEGELGARHNLDYHIVGSDAAAVVLKTGPGVTRWKPGDEVTVHCNYVDMEAPGGHDDSMMDPSQRIWGFESNFGGLADIAMVKANQLMPKPRHLTWEEAACLGLVSSTSYRMLVSPNGAQMKQG
ncbi:MAG TPA: alcohol dehydrogenase catalytic domain-containing protein, partial [Actinomycetota bacterium]